MPDPSGGPLPWRADLVRIWDEALGLSACPTNLSFLILGGESISAIQIVAQVRALTGFEYPLPQMLGGATIDGMARWLAKQATHPGPAALPPLVRQPRGAGPQPLSTGQRRMWLAQAFMPGTSAYNVSLALRLQGPLDQPRMLAALHQVWSRHEAMRTRLLVTPQGLAQQAIEPELPAPQACAWALTTSPGHAARHMPCPSQGLIQHASLAHLPPAERQALLAPCLAAMANTPLELAQALPWRCLLLGIDAHTHLLIWVAHHILVDLWGSQIVARDLAQAYQALGQDTPLTAAPDAPLLHGIDHAHWQALPAVQARQQAQLQHWRQQLQDLPPSNLIPDHPFTEHWHTSASQVSQPIGEGLRQAWQAHAHAHGHTPYVSMLAALAIVVGRHSRQSDVAILSPVANRLQPGTANMVASLSNTLVMRIDLSGDPSFAQLLDRVRHTTSQAQAHQELPFDELVEQLPRTHQHHGLVLGLQVMFNVLSGPEHTLRFEGLQAERLLIPRATPQFPLSLLVDPDTTGSMRLVHADQLYSSATAQAWLQQFTQVLETGLATPEQPISRLAWGQTASQQALAGWNATAQAWPAHPHVDALLAAQARATPEAPAARFQDQVLSHAALSQRAQALAQHLTAQGIGPGHRVGIHLPRGLTLLVALRAVLMCGAAYVPLDPRYPPERLLAMAQDAQLSLLISQTWRSVPGWQGAPLPCLNPLHLPLHPPNQAHPAAQAPISPAQAHDLAYLIYTSGSTGRPKGVAVSQGAVLNLLHSMAREPGLQAHDTLLAVTTLSFDIAVLELLLPLAVGAQVLMASDDDTLDGLALRQLIERHHVTAMQATPATWQALLDAGWQAAPGFKALVGGEALPLGLAQQLLAMGTELWNLYGPTETTVWSTCWRVQQPERGIHIGRPVANTQVHIVDDSGQPCPVGVPGEILICGEGLAQGYWQQPELSAQRFIAWPHPPAGTASRAFRTGDLGRWRHDGQLQHLGRLDQQLKVRGHRIEPGDIEAQLLQHPAVARCAVVAREDSPGDVRLVAYVVARDPGVPMPSAHAWQAWLRERLPAFMVPQHLVPLPALPLLPNGKLQRQALPAPSPLAAPAQGGAQATQTYTYTAWEARLAAVWRAVLKVGHIQPQDHFLDLGGHSLLVMQAINRLAADTGVRVAPRRYLAESLSQLALSYERAALQPEVHSQATRPPSMLASLLRPR